MREQMLEHPDITRALLTGYPYPVERDVEEAFDEDAAYEERRCGE